MWRWSSMWKEISFQPCFRWWGGKWIHLHWKVRTWTVGTSSDPWSWSWSLILTVSRSWSKAMGQISSNSKKTEACEQQAATTPEKQGGNGNNEVWEVERGTPEKHPDEKERLTMCRGRLRDSFRERCQRMQLTRSRFSASMRRKTQGIKVGGGRRWELALANAC